MKPENLHRIAADALLEISPEIIGSVDLVLPLEISDSSFFTLNLIYNGLTFPFKLSPPVEKNTNALLREECCIRVSWQPEGLLEKQIVLVVFFLERKVNEEKGIFLKKGVYKLKIEELPAQKNPSREAKGFFNTSI